MAGTPPSCFMKTALVSPSDPNWTASGLLLYHGLPTERWLWAIPPPRSEQCRALVADPAQAGLLTYGSQSSLCTARPGFPYTQLLCKEGLGATPHSNRPHQTRAPNSSHLWVEKGPRCDPEGLNYSSAFLAMLPLAASAGPLCTAVGLPFHLDWILSYCPCST